MAPTRTEVRSEIENKKEQINSKLEMLGDRFETVADRVKVRHYIDTFPWTMVGAAAGLGLFLGIRRSRTLHEREAEPYTSRADYRNSRTESRESHPSFAGEMAKRLLPTLGSAVLRHVMSRREEHAASRDREFAVEDLSRGSAEDFSRDYAVEDLRR